MIAKAIDRRNSCILAQMYSQALAPSIYKGSIPIIHPIHHKFRDIGSNKFMQNKGAASHSEIPKIRLKQIPAASSAVKSSLELHIIESLKGYRMKEEYNNINILGVRKLKKRLQK
eukprot:TRINITY_DN9508_c0_g3_i1.p1 TRINITY_DN9508_c0_g3~~TRINITY_DN9508_c0_g3_i1.p1  ORF type:complete len:115 (+),score=16.18 TRINITY_DN9508_c0_g3_i1:157-501(+)